MLKNKIVKNASWIIGCKIIQSILGLIISMFTARYLGPSNYGIINYASSLVTFVAPIMNLGLSNILVNEVVQRPEEEGKIFGTAVGVSLIGALGCIVGVTGFAYVANRNSTETIIVCALYSLLLIFQAVDLVQYWFQAKYLSKYTSIVAVVAYFCVALYKIFLLATGKSIRWFAVANSIDFMIIAGALLVIYKKCGGMKMEFSLPVAKRMLSSSRHYILSSMMINMFSQSDKIMITLMIGEEYTGFYSAAVACAGITNFVFAAIIDSARPNIFSSQKSGDLVAFESNVSDLYSIITYLSLAQCVGITILAKPIILILYGKAYMPAVAALQVIVWYSTFAYFGSVRNIWILAEQKQKYLWIMNLSGALINIVLNLVLIPIWGIIGAAVASLATQIFTNVIVGFIIKPIRRNNLLMWKGLDARRLVRLVKKLR